MDERVFARYMADLAYFLTLFENNPSEKYHLPVALAYLKLAKYEECASVCVEGLKRFPSHCPTKTLLAEAYINLGKVAQARELLHDVVAEDDGNYKALKLLGMVMQAEDLSDRAVRYFRLAYFKAPEDYTLIKMIEDLGAKIDFDEILEEQSKLVGKRTEEVDEDTRTYNEINQSIKNAEIMMQELFDTDIDLDLVSDKTVSLDDATLDDLIERTVNKSHSNEEKAETVIEDNEPINNIENENESEEVIDNIDDFEAEEDPLVSEMQELIIEEAKEDEKRDEEATNDLVKELSNIGFATPEVTDFTIPTEIEGVGIDSKTGDIVVDLYNVGDTSDPLDNIVVKPPLDTEKEAEEEVNLTAETVSESDTLADDLTMSDIDIEETDIDTDKISSEVDKLLEEANNEIISQIDLDIESKLDKHKEEDNIEDVSEDFFEKSLATADISAINLSNEEAVENTPNDTVADLTLEAYPETPIVDVNTVESDTIADNTEPNNLNDIEKFYSDMLGDETFFNVSEAEGINNQDKGKSVAFYQSDIFDEILEKSNMTVNDMISQPTVNQTAESKNSKMIMKLEKKLKTIRKRRRKG